MKSVTLRPTKTMIDAHNTNSCIWLGNSKQTEEQIHHEPHRLSNQKNFGLNKVFLVAKTVVSS